MPGTVLKQGWGVKQGHVRKNWKRRFFVVTSQGFSYFKSDLVWWRSRRFLISQNSCFTFFSQDKDPIRTVPVSAILTAKRDTSILAEYRDNLFMVATTERKYYIQVCRGVMLFEILFLLANLFRVRFNSECFDGAFSNLNSNLSGAWHNKGFLRLSQSRSLCEESAHIIRSNAMNIPNKLSSCEYTMHQAMLGDCSFIPSLSQQFSY